MATLVPCGWDNRSIQKDLSGRHLEKKDISRRHFSKAFRNPWQALKMCLTLESAIHLLGIYPEETLEDVPKDASAVMFISALCIVAKKKKKKGK